MIKTAEWIQNSDLRLSKFISRRIDIIRNLSCHAEWNYCCTDENPTDVTTRPVSDVTSSDRLKMWLEGLITLKKAQQLFQS